MTAEDWDRRRDDAERVRSSDRIAWLDDRAKAHRDDDAIAARFRGVSATLADAAECRSILMRLRAIAVHPERERAMAIVIAERDRQREVEGYDPHHDDDHGDGSILAAARCYLDHVRGVGSTSVPSDWPWEPAMWKPKDRAKALAKAGALALAEAERLRRAGAHDRQATELLELVLWELAA